MPRPLIVYDLDGTLADSNKDLVPALNAAIATEGLPPVEIESVGHIVGHGARKMIQRAYDLNDREISTPLLDQLFELFIAHYSNHIADRTTPFPGTENMLRRFAMAGWNQAVCTNKLEGLSNLLLEKLGLAHRFSAIAGADTFNVRKPDPTHLHQTILAAGGKITDTVYVGDSVVDHETARAAGIPFIGVSFGYSTVPMSDLRPDLMIDTFDELTVDAAAALL